MIEDSIREIIREIGEDARREGLLKTPERAWEAIRYLTRGYRENFEEIAEGALFEHAGTQPVICRDIEFVSLCEHHLLPFTGFSHVGYVPAGKIIGFSKIARVVDHFAARLQVQERLNDQVGAALVGILKPSALVVVMDAVHLCMTARGVKKSKSRCVTTFSHGETGSLISLIGNRR